MRSSVKGSSGRGLKPRMHGPGPRALVLDLTRRGGGLPRTQQKLLDLHDIVVGRLHLAFTSQRSE
eukprot:3400695-Rhodomonas_salina.1